MSHEIIKREFTSLQLRNVMKKVLDDLLADRITYRKANAAANVAKVIIASAELDQRRLGPEAGPFLESPGE